MNDVMDQIIESLAFEIEAVPNGNKELTSTGLHNDPINIKIRIRNKDQNKVIRQGVISLPNKDTPVYGNDRIQLSNSDQTIMSFDVLMEQDRTNKQRKLKRKFRFFKRGSCLGNQTEEDHYEFQKKGSIDIEQRVPIKSTSINDMNKRNFTLTKMYGSSDARRMENRTQKDILGKCKPGGCLDPPYGEDKYSYVPKIIKMSKTEKDSNKRKPDDVAYQKPRTNIVNKKEKDDVSYVSEKKEQLSFSNNNNISSTKRSNSIITYPSTSSNESLSKDGTQKTVQYSNDSRISHTSNENVETYFISPKKIKIRNDKFQIHTDNFTDVDGDTNAFMELVSSSQNILNELKLESLKNYDDANQEGDSADPKMIDHKDNEDIENFDKDLITQISSLADLNRNNKIATSLPHNEVSSKGSYTSLSNNPLAVPDTDSLKVSANVITRSLASISHTKTIVEQRTNNKVVTNKKSSSETFKKVQSLTSTKLDTEMTLTGNASESNLKENRVALEPEYLLKSEEVTLIKDLSSSNSLRSNLSYNTRNENTKEVINPYKDTDSIFQNAFSCNEESTNKKSIDDYHLEQNENVTAFNQDLYTPLTNMIPNLTSDISNVDINRSISFTGIDNESNSERKDEQNSLDYKKDLNILSHDSINTAKIQEIDSKIASLTKANEKHNSILSIDVSKMSIGNVVNDGYINLTPLTGLEPKEDPVQFYNNDLQISDKIDTDNFVTHETSHDKTTLRSVKSDIEHTSVLIDSRDTEFERISQRISPPATQSMTSMVRDLNTYNTLLNYLVTETKDFDSARDLDTGIGDSVNMDITTKSKSNEAIETFSLVNNNLEQQDSIIKEIKSGSNVSLSNIERVQVPPPLELQFINDTSETHTELGTDDPTKSYTNENLTDWNKIDEHNIQSTQETFIKLEEEHFKNDIKTAIAELSTEADFIVSRDDLLPVDNVEISNNDQLTNFLEKSITPIDTNRNDKHEFVHLMSNSSNLKDTVYLDMAFQRFYTEKDGNVIRTIETKNMDVERYEDDNILQFMTLARLDDFPITISIDREKNLLLQITTSKEKDDQKKMTEKESILSKHYSKHKLVVFDEDNDDTFANIDLDKKKLRASVKKCITSKTKCARNLQSTLDNVYNQKLLPLHNIIKDLKSEIDGLLKQQLLIKEKLKNGNQTQLHTVPNYRTCCCNEKLFLKYQK